MASKRRLYLKALNNPRGLRFEEFTALIAAFGFVFRRQTGSHRIYGRRDIAERVNVQPLPDGKAKAAQVREFLKVVDRHGLDVEEDEP
jgi:predicted RNA binding protein YcfA (HicA-like mRNA interferase family)